jgi:hypothetical protein
MNQEQKQPEAPLSVDALLAGYTGACKACAAEAETGKDIEDGHTCPDIEPVRLGEGHLPSKSLPDGMAIGERLQAWAETGQPGAAQGVPCAPPGTSLAR